MSFLVIGRLTIASSYGRNVERPATERFDTVQFYVPTAGDVLFRVRTFALDDDIHVHQIGGAADPEGLAHGNINRVYGEVLASVRTIALPTMSTQDLTEAGVDSGELEFVEEPGYAFWNPDGRSYQTRSVPAGPGEREGMRLVVYLGGIARFWLPQSWEISMSAEEGRHFYGPDGDSVLRLNVLTFDTSASDRTPTLPVNPKPGERLLDSGRLATGHEFAVIEWDSAEDDTRLRFWRIMQVLDGQCRIFSFSYAYPIGDEAVLADELAMVDREVRRMVPHPDPV